MRRDLEFVREILLRVESEAGPSGLGRDALARFANDDHDSGSVLYHVRIMAQGGLLDVATERISNWGGDTEVMSLRGLTWAGHEYLDSVRDPKTVAEVKKRFGEAALNLPFEIFSRLVMRVVEGGLPV